MYTPELYQEYLNATKDFNRNDFACITKFTTNPTKYRRYAAVATKLTNILSEIYPTAMNISEALTLAKNNIKEIPKCPTCGCQLSIRLDSYTYPKYCSAKCKNSRQGPPSKKSISIDGVEYLTIANAATALGISRDTVRFNLLDCNYPSWRFVGDHDQQCRDMLSKFHTDLLDRDVVAGFCRDRTPMRDIMAKYQIKTHSTLKLIYAYHSIPTTFQQMPVDVHATLNNESQIRKMYRSMNTNMIAETIGCSPSTVLSTINRYKIPKRRGRSAIEHHISEWLISIGVDVVTNGRSLIGAELDILVKDKNLAIELDGTRYHTEGGLAFKGKTFHQDRYHRCADIGVQLLRFTDIETTYKLPLVKSMILAKLGKSPKIIHARKCSVTKVSASMAREFFNANHISGASVAKETLGLIYQGELVCCMSFGVPRFNSKYQWEIIRLATAMNCTVVGGAGKLFAEFRRTHQGQTLMTYSDNRVGSGAIYQRLGMTMMNETSPGYFYVKGLRRFSRQQFQANRIQRVCPTYDPKLTEWENARNSGYSRYWDCGNKVFSITL